MDNACAIDDCPELTGDGYVIGSCADSGTAQVHLLAE